MRFQAVLNNFPCIFQVILLRLRETQKALQLPFYLIFYFLFFLPFFFSFSSLFVNRLAKFIFKVLPNCCFERVLPGRS